MFNMIWHEMLFFGILCAAVEAHASTQTNLDCPKIKELYDLRRKVKEWTRGEGDSMDTTDKES